MRIHPREVTFYTIWLPQDCQKESSLLSLDNFQTDWKPYCFSWQYGVFDNPGGQGYHGLKGKVDNRMLILDQGGHQLFKTHVCIAKSGKYRIEQEGENADFLYLDGKLIQDKVVTLKKGLHRLLIAYANTPKRSYVLAEKKSYSVDDRKRGSVVFYKENAVKQHIHSGKVVSCRILFLPINIHSISNTCRTEQ